MQAYPAVQNKAITISLKEKKGDKWVAAEKVKAMYVTFDKKANAVESAPSEWNAWNSYKYEGLNSVVEGTTATIKISPNEDQEIINDFPQKRIFPQIAPDGRQPHELQRTLAFHYSQYNLPHFIDIMLMAKNLGIKLDDITSTDGRNFYKAMDFLASYVGKGLSEWPYQQISGWESSIQNFCKDLYRTAVYLNPARKDYLNLYYAHRILKPHDNFNLLYIQATALDNPIRK